MFKFLNPNKVFVRNKFNYPGHDYVANGLERNLDRTKNMLSVSDKFITNNNLIATLLQVLPEKIELNDKQYYYHILSHASNFLVDTGIGHDSEPVKEKHNIVYSEISEFWFLKADGDLTPEKPVTIVNHPYFDLSMPVLGSVTNVDHIKDNDSPYYAAFLLDLGSLAVGYRKWARERDKLKLDRSSGLYIKEVVLPSMLDDHISVALFNIFQSTLTGDNGISLMGTKEVSLIDYTTHAIESYSEMIADAMGKGTDIVTLYETVKTLPDRTIRDTVSLFTSGGFLRIDLVGNLFLLFRHIKFILLYIDVSGDSSVKRDMVKLKHDLKAAKNDSGLWSRMDNRTTDRVKDMISELLELL